MTAAPTLEDLEDAARALLARLEAAGAMVATAESCTGGLIAATLTEIAGSSTVVDRGFVTYSNAAKTDLLGVPMTLIASYGAVSEPVALAMATGALSASRASLAVSVTGVAGPSGGSPDKPVGTVHFGLAGTGIAPLHSVQHFTGDRRAIRRLSVLHAFGLLDSAL